MATRNLNKVMLIGNLTRDPELRYTPQGSAVASFVVATNREWVADGEKKQAADFHNAVAWNKLAEICSQLLKKGIKVYVEGRLQTRSWEDTDGKRRYKTEIVVDDMIILTRKDDQEGESSSFESNVSATAPVTSSDSTQDLDAELGFDDFDFDDLDSSGTTDKEVKETDDGSTEDAPEKEEKKKK